MLLKINQPLVQMCFICAEGMGNRDGTETMSDSVLDDPEIHRNSG